MKRPTGFSGYDDDAVKMAIALAKIASQPSHLGSGHTAQVVECQHISCLAMRVLSDIFSDWQIDRLMEFAKGPAKK